MKRISTSATLRRLLIHCEQYCVAECCHSNAFRIDQQTVERWLSNERIDRTDELIKELSDISGAIADCKNNVYFDIRELESTWSSEEALGLFGDCSRALVETKAEQVVSGDGGQAPSFASLCESCAAVPPHLTFALKMKPI
ncbi:MAG: DUF6331 family protein [Verrucomicrobiales bacterium]